MNRNDYLISEKLKSPGLILQALKRLQSEVRKEGRKQFNEWKPTIHRKEFEFSAKNFAEYLALRRRDLRHLQAALIPLGLSSLGRSEARVMPNLEAVIAALSAMISKANALTAPKQEDFLKGSLRLEANADDILGKAPDRRNVRMMITLPSDAAKNYSLVSKLLEKGMNIARINCAHDSEEEWSKMIAHIRRAEKSLGLTCKIFMDLGGPKVRTGEIVDKRTRDKGKQDVIAKGELIFLYGNKPRAKNNETLQVACAIPEILPSIGVGHQVWIDDGHIGSVVEEKRDEGLILRVTNVEAKGRKVKSDKGLNFPDSTLSISPLTSKDLNDLNFICKNADAINYSFVQSAEDVLALQNEISTRLHQAKRNGKILKKNNMLPIGMIAKIETKRAVENLPEIIIQGAGNQPFGVMIARGDLAVEIGYQRIAEIQEELLWLCEAAHVPVIWATQVLESLVKKGIPSRAEITDAAMSERAECVMLNKGDYILEAIEILDNVLMRMGQHQTKKMPQLRELYSWRN
ncbi:MAG: pyruvate kinase [Chloroherpetonaceae bacterium]|nr:pyruvate kinase [Chloroherpetonaceae bacterium]